MTFLKVYLKGSVIAYMRRFNVLGVCNPKRHYMVDIHKKVEQIKQMIDEGFYFTINRARQYGKTTTIRFLEEYLKAEYIVIMTSFEGIGEVIFQNEKKFNENFIDTIAQILKEEKVAQSLIEQWERKEGVDSLKLLGDKITAMCTDAQKPIVLIIDEVDKSCNHKLFLDFLGMLRTKYLMRDRYATFHGVILAGVHNIKTIRYSGSNQNSKNNSFDDNARKQDSPWNIAADFEVDMSFNPAEIATMITAYEKDHHTSMDVMEISHEIYHYTSGYPFLVSRICQKIDEKLDKDWTLAGIKEAVGIILQEQNTLFDDMFKNFENSSDLYALIYELLVMGMEKNFVLDNPTINLAATYGIITNKNGKIALANEIFAIRIYNYFISKDETSSRRIPNILRTDVAINGTFDMALTLKKFAEHYKTIYNEKDIRFLERHCRLIFLTYLKPLINGAGFYHIEAETLDARRMDIVVDYGNEQFIIELKLWYGDSSHEKAHEQLSSYLDTKNADTGYLVTFDFRKKKRPKYQWENVKGRRILDVIV